MALLAMAIANLGMEARSFTGIAGGRHHRRGARQGPDHRRHAGPDLVARSTEGAIADRRRLPGRLAEHQGHHHAGPGRLRHHGRRARGRARARTSARSTPTSTGCSPPTRGWCASARRIPRITYEEMLEMAACGAKVLHPALRRVRAAVRPADPRAVLVQRQDRHLGQRTRWRSSRRKPDGAGHHLRGRTRPQRGARSPWSACPTSSGAAARHLRDPRRGRDQHRHDRAERVGDRHRPHGHLVHAAQGRRPAAHGDAASRPGRRRLPGPALRRPGSARSR